jgi:hypothetical protein
VIVSHWRRIRSAVHVPVQASNVNAGVETAERLRSVAAPSPGRLLISARYLTSRIGCWTKS